VSEAPIIGRDVRSLKLRRPRTDKSGMAVHVICPSLRCRKILTLADDVRGTLVSCRYCQMQFRVPQLRRTPAGSQANGGGTAAMTPPRPFTPPTRPN
jgi:hypothetical protein